MARTRSHQHSLVAEESEQRGRTRSEYRSKQEKKKAGKDAKNRKKVEKEANDEGEWFSYTRSVSD